MKCYAHRIYDHLFPRNVSWFFYWSEATREHYSLTMFYSVKISFFFFPKFLFFLLRQNVNPWKQSVQSRTVDQILHDCILNIHATSVCRACSGSTFSKAAVAVRLIPLKSILWSAIGQRLDLQWDGKYVQFGSLRDSFAENTLMWKYHIAIFLSTFTH